MVGAGFVVADTAAVFADPGEGSFHDPATRQRDEAGFGAFDDRHGKVQDLMRPVHKPARVSGVRPCQRDGGESLPQSGQQSDRAVAVLDAGGGDHDRQQ